MVVADFGHLKIYENLGFPLPTIIYIQYKVNFQIKI